jgi:uncharacterized membrane protein YhaH (DUF805 family)
MDWYINVLKKYAVFSGRARRREYWMFCLFNTLFTFAAMFLDHMLGTNKGAGVVYCIYTLAILIPSLAVAARRLHDTGKSGWFLLIGLIPLIGAIWIFVLFCFEGEAAENKYGLNPKSAG